MNRQKIRKAYESVRPDEEARARMLESILSETSEIPPAGKDNTMKHKKMRPVVLVAIIALIATMTVTAFASEEISGWFRQYFSRSSENGLTSGQIEYLDEHEQIIEENQSRNGWDLKLKSVLSDGYTVYATVGLTAPDGVTGEDLRNLWASDIDFYDENLSPCASWSMNVYDDMDGLENTADLVFEMNPADWNSGNLWTLRIKTLGKLFHDEAYEKELLETKYAGQENIMLTDEEAAKVHQQITLAEGPWEFTFDLSKAQNEVMELIAEPVMVEVCMGFKEDGTDVFDEVKVTSFVLSPLSATIYADCGYAPDFTAGGRKVYVVMTDGSRIELITNWGSVGRVHFNVESPIILEDVDYVLLADGTKFMAN